MYAFNGEEDGVKGFIMGRPIIKYINKIDNLKIGRYYIFQFEEPVFFIN
jgi:hypothetical protein